MAGDMISAVAPEVEGRHLHDPTEEGVMDLGESRQSELLLLSQGAIGVVEQHAQDFVTLVKDAWRHLDSDEPGRRRGVIDDLFEQVCERLNLDYYRVTAEQANCLETSRDMDSDEDDRVLHCSLWVDSNGGEDVETCGKTMVLEVTTRGGEATTVLVDPAFSNFFDVGEKAVGFDLFVNSCKVKYLLGLVRLVGNAHANDKDWKDKDLWLMYCQLWELHNFFIESVTRRVIASKYSKRKEG